MGAPVGHHKSHRNRLRLDPKGRNVLDEGGPTLHVITILSVSNPIILNGNGQILPEDGCTHVILGWLPVDPHQILHDVVGVCNSGLCDT